VVAGSTFEADLQDRRPTAVLFRVPQGSVLGPIPFRLYTADLLGIAETHRLQPHLNHQTLSRRHMHKSIVSVVLHGDNEQLESRVSASVSDVGSWIRANRLKLNKAKT